MKRTDLASIMAVHLHCIGNIPYTQEYGGLTKELGNMGSLRAVNLKADPAA